jgi:hypothetical protein
MSSLESSTKHSKRTQMSAALFIVTLIIFATFVIIESASLQWPLATYIGKAIPFSKTGSKIANSSLLVSAASFAPSTYSCSPFGGNPTGSCLPPFNDFLRFPIFNANVTIKTSGTNPVTVATNYTDTQGQIYFILRPNAYEVDFTSSITNLTIPIVATSGNTTELDIGVNESTYVCTYVNISNPPSSTLIAPWNTIFLTVQSNSAISQNANETVYLQPLPTSNQGIVTFPNTFPKIGIHVLGGYYSSVDATQWLEVRANSIIPFNSTYSIDVLTYFSLYTTREYPTQTIQNSSS